MNLEILVPSVGESIIQGTLSVWLKSEGEYVEEGADLFELETDKATVTVPAPASGVLSIQVAAGADVSIGSVVGHIDTDAAASRPQGGAAVSGKAQPKAGEARPQTGMTSAKTAPRAGAASSTHAPPAAAAQIAPAQQAGQSPQPVEPPPPSPGRPLSPAVRRIVEESGLEPTAIAGTGPSGRITKEDALRVTAERNRERDGGRPREAAPSPAPTGRGRRVPLSTIRKRIAERLVEAQRNTAYLTTFNEVDMGRVMELRARYKEEFERGHGVKLGIMSFFVKACCRALKEQPEVNAMIEGGEIVYNDSCHIGVAVSTERGLLVPILRDADGMGLARIEAAIADLAARARDRKILPDELSGGTFTITNGGVFGSLLSTPLPNYPQTAILGMHAIQRRPVAVGAPDLPGGERVEIRPMMYVALTYDHRLIDGRDAVTFLRRVKEMVEDPARLLLEV